MNILKLHIKNFRCIELQEVDFRAGKITKIIGKNGAGKSSIIDAIFSAVQGGSFVKGKKWRRYELGNLIKHDANEARITLALQDDDKYISISRSIAKSRDGSTVCKKLEISPSIATHEKIETKDVVNLFSLLSIDIVEFMNATPPEQFDKILEVVDREKLNHLENQEKMINDRISINNINKRKVDDVIRTSEVKIPVQIIDTTTLAKTANSLRSELEEYKNEKHNFFKKLDQNKLILSKIENSEQLIKEYQESIAKQENLINELKEEKKSDDENIKTETVRLKEKYVNGDEYEKQKLYDIDILEKQMESSTQLNRQATLYDEYKKACDEKEKLQTATEDEKYRLARIVKQKSDLFKTAGITSDIVYNEEQGLVIDGKIFSDLSSGQKVRTIVNILASIKQNRVNLLIVRDASILDSETMQVLREVAKEHSLSVLLEIVDDVEGRDSPIEVQVEE